MRSFSSDRPSNDRYETDIRYTFELCHWILKPIGMYPFVFSRASRRERTASVLLILVCCSILQFIIVPFSHHVLFSDNDMNTFVKNLGPLTFCLTTFFKYCYFSMKGSAIGRCVKHIERDWKMLRDEDHRVIMLRYVTMSRNLIKLCAIFLYIGGLSYNTVIPLFSKKSVNGNVTIRPLTYPGYEEFFDVQKSPAYEIVFCMHCVYVMITANITMAAYSLTTIFATHTCGQIKIQTTRLEDLTKRGMLLEKGVSDRLAVVVSGHVEILKFTRMIESALHEIFLIEVIVSTVLLCLIEYLLMMEWESSDSIGILTYVTLLTSFTFNILIFCYVGELLLGQGSEIAHASYDTEWYNLPRRKARDIVLVLAITKHPIKLTAGKIFVLSLNTFGAVLKSSVVYMNMLRTYELKIDRTMDDTNRNDVANSLKYCRRLLKPIGLWPLIYSHTSKLNKVLSIILIAWCTLTVLFVLVPCGYFCVFHVKNVKLKMKLLGPVLYSMLSMLRYSCLVLKTPAFKHCIEDIENDWKLIDNPEHRAIMIKNAMVTQRMTVAFTIIIYSSAVSYHAIVPFFSNALENKKNNTIRALPIPGYELFVDAYSSPTYEIIRTHLFVQMARLKYLVADNRKESDRSRMLVVIVNGHSNALRYTRRILNALETLCFVEVLLSSILLCLCENLCVEGWKTHDMIFGVTIGGFMLSITFNIFVLCHAGELLVEEAEKFGNAAYNIEWYNLPPNRALDLVLMIGIAKFPPRLTGGKIFDISINTFSASTACIEAVSMYDRSCSSVDGQLRNYHYQNDIHYTLQMCQWLLKPIGVWRLLDQRSSKLEHLVSIVLMTICFSSLFFIVLPSGHYIFFAEKSGMSYHTVMQFLSKDRSSEFLSREKSKNYTYKRENYTYKPLAYPGYDWFIDTQTSPTYEIVFFFHCFAAMIMYNVTTAAYSLAAIFVTHICGQIQIQMARLEDLVERTGEKDDGPDPLVVIVRDHVKVLRFAKNVEETLRDFCLVEIFESTLILCLLEYYCLVEWQNSDTIAMLTFFTLLTSFTFNIFIFCYIGEILSEQCSQIGSASYEIDWYNLPAKRAYDLILLSVISQYPPKLTAGKIIDLSLNTFSSVVKTSVVYLNLLRTVTNW
ncbi:PREDICTED: uncharacterized protein LOC108577312 [Habropoda laboriosa]|uniref:uncharacterized protein LOC108577312 n=1 Tax=Habropoda laboriosa TaxID=597456 RepID=UPI00083DA2CB|nr:PREDICTED: uncharacterized protein LOC108577312 [Habropoda laboriosa]